MFIQRMIDEFVELTSISSPSRDERRMADALKKKLLALFKAAEPTILMDEEERGILRDLESPVTVYRGVTSYNAKNVKALSWTLDENVAQWFARRYGEQGTVYQAQIHKDHIYAIFTGRNESEVIVDPKHLVNIEPVQDLTMDLKM